MQANNSKQKGNQLIKRNEQFWKISKRTEPNMCSHITCVSGNQSGIIVLNVEAAVDSAHGV